MNCSDPLTRDWLGCIRLWISAKRNEHDAGEARTRSFTLGLAKLLADSGRYAEAMEIYEKAVRADRCIESLTHYGLLLAKLERIPEAIAVFEEVNDLGGKEATVSRWERLWLDLAYHSWARNTLYTHRSNGLE